MRRTKYYVPNNIINIEYYVPNVKLILIFFIGKDVLVARINFMCSTRVNDISSLLLGGYFVDCACWRVQAVIAPIIVSDLYHHCPCNL